MVSLKINKSGSEYIGADFPSSMCGAVKVVINTNKSGQEPEWLERGGHMLHVTRRTVQMSQTSVGHKS